MGIQILTAYACCCPLYSGGERGIVTLAKANLVLVPPALCSITWPPIAPSGRKKQDLPAS